ncbi:MAG: hypothetical protein CMC97_06340 [Flavobacteriales bacterium]|nr:hypothetical protein [Flavobacteriales bacterium]
MGCRSQIRVWSDDEQVAFAAMRAAWEGMNELEMVLSDWNAQAEVAQLNAHGNKKLSPELLAAARTAREIARDTGGAFDFEKGGLFFAWRQQRSRGELLDPAEAQRLAVLPPPISPQTVSPNSQPAIVGTSEVLAKAWRPIWPEKSCGLMDAHTSRWTVQEIFW